MSEARAARAFLPPPLLPAPPERISGSKIASAILQEMVSSFVVNILKNCSQFFSEVRPNPEGLGDPLSHQLTRVVSHQNDVCP